MSLEKVKEYFKKYDLEDRIYEFETSSATVELAANVLGCLPDRIAKSLTFIVDNKPIMILACGTARIDNHKYKEKFNTKAKMLSMEEVEKYIQIIRSTAHLIMEFSREGGFENASGL